MLNHKTSFSTRNTFLNAFQPVQSELSADDNKENKGNSSASPRNTLNNSSYLLSDFGICAKLSNSDYDVIEGDRAYLPPEILDINLGNPEAKDLIKVDIFAFGLILLQMMTGIDLPTQGAGWHLLRKSNQAAKLLEGLNYSQKLKTLVCRCLSPIPAERPSPSQILANSLIRRDFLDKIVERRENGRLARRTSAQLIFSNQHQLEAFPFKSQVFSDSADLKNGIAMPTFSIE